jgi:hypothetical protein
MRSPVFTVFSLILALASLNVISGCASDEGYQKESALPRIRRAGLPPPLPPPEPTVWWEDLTFDPARDGRIALDVIDATGWASANYIQVEDLLGKIPTYDLAEFERSEFTLQGQADLNGNGPEETYEVGFFRSGDGASGSFLVVREQGAIVDIFSQDDGRDFSAIGSTQNAMLWTHCMNCSDFENLSWDGAKFVLE